MSDLAATNSVLDSTGFIGVAAFDRSGLFFTCLGYRGDRSAAGVVWYYPLADAQG